MAYLAIMKSAARLAAALILLAGCGPALAAPDDFQSWLKGVWPDAQKIGVSRRGFDAATAGLRPDLGLPDLAQATQGKPNKAQAEFLRPAGAYLDEGALSGLAANGARLSVRWADTLKKIESSYGVPGNILLAIFGRETDFGAEHPKHSVIQVIATEAFAGRRKEYFREQLIWALKMVDDKDVAPADFKGSWAGAFGLTQFMPTGFRDYAVDFDGDGKKDVWNSVPDALATSAVELSKAVDRDGTPVGWKPGMRWGYEVRKPANGLDCTAAGFDRPKALGDWLKAGFARAHGKPIPTARLADKSYLLLPEGSAGPAFLVTDNFLALKAYNYADLYALFVGHLADRIAGEGPFETPWAEATHLTEAAIFEQQKRLVGLGYDVGKVDGKIGWKMRIALGEFEKSHNLPVNCYPSEADAKVLGRQAAKLP